MIAEKIKFDL